MQSSFAECIRCSHNPNNQSANKMRKTRPLLWLIGWQEIGIKLQFSEPAMCRQRRNMLRRAFLSMSRAGECGYRISRNPAAGCVHEPAGLRTSAVMKLVRGLLRLSPCHSHREYELPRAMVVGSPSLWHFAMANYGAVQA